MSMYAVIVTPYRHWTGYPDMASLPIGKRVEVVGFVHHSRKTWAVWRDDEGELHEAPTAAIRMEPSTVKVEA